MGSKKPTGIAPHVPNQETPTLEIVDYLPPGKRSTKLVGGAYDPYETPVHTGNTVRLKRPRTDLRRLSTWIKTKNEVEAQRESGPEEKSRDR
jgi:hypothetical protein